MGSGEQFCSVITTGFTCNCIQPELEWDLNYRKSSPSVKASLLKASVHPLIYPGQHGNCSRREKVEATSLHFAGRAGRFCFVLFCF